MYISVSTYKYMYSSRLKSRLPTAIRAVLRGIFHLRNRPRKQGQYVSLEGWESPKKALGRSQVFGQKKYIHRQKDKMLHCCHCGYPWSW